MLAESSVRKGGKGRKNWLTFENLEEKKHARKKKTVVQ